MPIIKTGDAGGTALGSVVPAIHRRTVAMLVATFGVGAYLRCQQWLTQVLLDDEWHAVHKLLSASYREIASSFGIADYSIPLTLVYKAVADTIGLSEWSMRSLPLAAGLIAPVFFVRWALRRHSVATVALFAWLLATSPMLVIYSQMARPYALLVMLVPAALYFAYRWWYGGKRRFLFAWAATAVCATYLHLLMVVIVLAPLAWFAVSGIICASHPLLQVKRWLRRIVGAALIMAMPLLILLLPPILTDFPALTSKAGKAELDQYLFVETAFLMTGSRFTAVVFAMFALACVGLWRIWRENKRSTAYVLFIFLIFQLALAVVRPAWLQHAVVYVRYNIAFEPLFLLAVAIGGNEIARQWTVAGPVRSLLLAAIALMFVAGSMLAPTTLERTSYGLHTYFTAHPDPQKNRARQVIDLMVMSTFWKDVAPNLAGADEIIGFAPWRFETLLSPLPVLERTANRRILPAFLHGYCADNRRGEVGPNQSVRMQNAVYPGNFEVMQVHHVAIVVWQKKWMRENDRQWLMREHGPFAGPLFDTLPACDATLRRDFGHPVYEDEWLVAFRVPR